MKTSQAGIDKIKINEGKQLDTNTGKHVIYPDSAGKLTIGYGHLLTSKEISSSQFKNGITEQQALDLLAHDLEQAEKSIDANVKVNLNQNQFDALVDFTFQFGSYAFKHSTLLKLLNKGKYEEVPSQLRRWNKVYNPKTKKKEPLDSISKRRERNVSLFTAPAQQVVVVGPVSPLHPEFPERETEVIIRQDHDHSESGQQNDSDNGPNTRETNDHQRSDDSSPNTSEPSGGDSIGDTMEVDGRTYDIEHGSNNPWASRD
jgi:GH24 family phage-related lysozyme (muramidase)